MNKKKISIALVGSTGSVGVTTLKIIEEYKNFFSLDYLACDRNYKVIKNQIKKFSPKYVFVNNQYCRKKLIKYFKNSNKIIFLDEYGNQFLKKYKKKFDKTILAISSFEGLKYAFVFCKYSKELLIANKESIICGGEILINKAKLFNCKITSIDSEHYSLSELITENNFKKINKIYLTASGGPFLKVKKNTFKKASVNRVTNHPKWSMGKKISVDSATMVNKIFEVIEAHILFKVEFNKIKIKIHEESLVHAAVIFNNGLVKFVMHNTTMEIPIRNSLLNNSKLKPQENFFEQKNKFLLTFDEEALDKYKIIAIGYKVMHLGHCAWILFNVFNDYFVKKFLKNEIFFYEIENNLIKLFNTKSIKFFCKKKIYKESDVYDVIEYGKNYLCSK